MISAVAGRAVQQIRTRDQPASGKGPRPRSARKAARPRRRGDRIECSLLRCVRSLLARRDGSLSCINSVVMGGIADINDPIAWANWVEFAPKRSSRGLTSRSAAVSCLIEVRYAVGQRKRGGDSARLDSEREGEMRSRLLD